jgi:hypothetical protein
MRRALGKQDVNLAIPADERHQYRGFRDAHIFRKHDHMQVAPLGSRRGLRETLRDGFAICAE